MPKEKSMPPITNKAVIEINGESMIVFENAKSGAEIF